MNEVSKVSELNLRAAGSYSEGFLLEILKVLFGNKS